MTRTARFKLGYALLLVAGVGLAIAAWAAFGFHPVAGLGLAAVLLLPSRIQGLLWRRFFRGHRLLQAGRAEEARRQFLDFREELRRRPSLKAAIWLSWGFYTRDVGAMTENNLGVSSILLDRADEARGHFEEALRIDPLSPLPHAGLADLALRAGDAAAARTHVERAAALGYRGSALDRLIRAVGAAYARVEGRGA